jgi:hypothetical protein
MWRVHTNRSIFFIIGWDKGTGDGEGGRGGPCVPEEIPITELDIKEDGITTIEGSGEGEEDRNNGAANKGHTSG